jgi:outer membrane biosynthesis protein TonB
MTPIGARPVEQVAPPPKRPEVVKPAAAKPATMTVPTKPTKQPVKPETTPKPTSPVAQPPTTGRQVTPGTSRAETGAVGQGTGLSLNSGGTGGDPSLNDFCCKGYLQDITNIIRSKWSPQQPERGVVMMKFTIQRDGQVTDVVVEQHGSFLLDRASQLPLINLRLPRLPDEYKEASLTIHLTFEYK